MKNSPRPHRNRLSVSLAKARRHRASRHHTTIQFEPLEDRRVLSADYQSLDGTGNNVSNPDWGSTGVQLLRIADVDYGNGIATPAGSDRASARQISNAVVSQSGSIFNDRYMSDFVWQWGQFLDHDIDLTDAASPAQSFPITVPTGDAYFDPTGTGTQTIGLNRSEYDSTTGTSVSNPRQQINAITAWIDASQIYGSDAARAAALRTFVGGRLKMTADNLLISNTMGLPNAPNTGSEFFISGDVRTNENVGLTAMHTLFNREHNRLADQIAATKPWLNDEQIYQEARKIVIAEMQAITFNEFLPTLLGVENVPNYTGYDSSVNPNIANEFSTALFRVGHTLLSSTLLRLDAYGNVIPQGNLPLKDAFFNPQAIRDAGIDPLLMGLSSQLSQEVDNQIVDAVRNFLFGPPGAGGFDLASLNIQRGRDHGLAGYNETRVAYGLAPVSSFSEISSDPTVQQRLASVYDSVDDIDLWVGALAEDHVTGSSVGELIMTGLLNQFTRLRDGDRYWYENQFSGQQLEQLRATTLADVIRNNTTLTNMRNGVFMDASVFQYHATAGTPLNATLRAANGWLRLTDNVTGSVLAQQLVAEVQKIVISGSASDDWLTVYVAGLSPTGGIELHGREGWDGIKFLGTSADDVIDIVGDLIHANGNTIRLTQTDYVEADGAAGNDHLAILANTTFAVSLFGGADNDNIFGGNQNDRLFGGPGNDLIVGGLGNDYIDGGIGDDELVGGSGADEIYGRDGNDQLLGDVGNDDLYAGPGDDVLLGGAGFDLLAGGTGDDILKGEAGNDQLIESSGNNWIDGGSGKDQLSINGGYGDDTITASPYDGSHNNGGAVTNWQSVERLRVDGGSGGFDRAFLYDSAGNDRFVARPVKSILRALNNVYSNEINGFDRVLAYANAGGNDDRALMYDSEGKDIFSASPEYAVLKAENESYYNYASGFDRVYAFGTSDYQHDVAYLYDSQGNDLLRDRTDYTYLQGSGFYNYVTGFDEVIVQASYGYDVADFRDVDSADTLFGRNDYATLTRADRVTRAVGFDHVTAVAKAYAYPTANVVDVDYIFEQLGTWG